MLLAIFNPPKNKFEKYWFFDLIKMVLWNWYIYIYIYFMFYLKFMCFCTTFIKKLKNFIKKQRRYEFLKIIVFWHNVLKWRHRAYCALVALSAEGALFWPSCKVLYKSLEEALWWWQFFLSKSFRAIFYT